MRSVVLVVPGRLGTRTGGSAYDRHMTQALRRQGWCVAVRELHESFPYPPAAALDHAARVFAAIPPGACVLVDGLALGAMPSVIEREASRLRLVALVHLPLAADVGLDRDVAARLEAAEQRALAAVTLVIVTGRATLDLLAPLGVPHDKVVIVEPGTAPAPIARGSGSDTLQLLCVATLNPGKGHEIMLQALAGVSSREWRLTCAGSLTRHAATVDRVRTTIDRLRLQDQVLLTGELDEEGLAECYDRADLFVLASLRETYGMAVAEALARGLPIVGTRTGAIPELVGDEAGVLAQPGDLPAFGRALARVMESADLRARLAEGARRVRARLPDWDEAAGRMAASLTLRMAGH